VVEQSLIDQLNLGAAVDVNVFAEGGEIPGQRLKCEHFSVRAYKFSQEQGVKADMSTNVYGASAGLDYFRDGVHDRRLPRPGNKTPVPRPVDLHAIPFKHSAAGKSGNPLARKTV
jgi:hypothetical protein